MTRYLIRPARDGEIDSSALRALGLVPGPGIVIEPIFSRRQRAWRWFRRHVLRQRDRGYALISAVQENRIMMDGDETSP